MKENRSFFNENIKHLRRANDISQEAMASMLGVKRSSYASWEEGRAEPSLYVVSRISNILGVSLDTLIKKDLRKLPMIELNKQAPSESPGYTIPEFPDDPFAKEEYMNVLKTMIDQIYRK